ncbi:MAG: hypothetical protein ABIG32_00350 [Candidatus Uhrbacteria bacterium]|nr:hypothetical protein [Patescibacteria group bacterium]MBU1907455.1 hypothetical protein [Patescibacteria group bacterium]
MAFYLSIGYAIIAAVISARAVHRAIVAKNQMWVGLVNYVEQIKRTLMNRQPDLAYELCEKLAAAPVSGWIKQLVDHREDAGSCERIIERIADESRGLAFRFRFPSLETLFSYASYLVLWGAFLVFGATKDERVLIVMAASLCSIIVSELVRCCCFRALHQHFTAAPRVLKELHEWMARV